MSHNGTYNGLLGGLSNGLHSELNSVKVVSDLGMIFTDSFSRTSLGSNYSTSGVASWTCDGVKLITSGGTGVYTNFMKRVSNGTCLEKHTQTIDFRISSVPTTTSYGIAVGILGNNSNDKRSYSLQVSTATGANAGKLFFSAGQNANPTFTIIKTSISGITINQNDLMRLVIIREQAVVSWELMNLTTGLRFSDSFEFSYLFSSPVHVPHAGGNFFIQSLGGTIDIFNWTVSSKEFKNAKTIYIGDSITYGVFAENVKNRWASKVIGETPNKSVVSGGASDKTSEVLIRIDEIILINPKYAVLMIGGNDVFFAVADATTKSNYATIVSRLKSAGITVIHCFATPRTSLDLRTWNAYLLSKYSSTDVVIQDTFYHLTTTPTSSYDLKAEYDSGDGTHPNKLGHSVVANAVYQSVPYIR